MQNFWDSLFNFDFAKYFTHWEHFFKMLIFFLIADVETLESEEEEEEMPSVTVGDVSYLLSEIDDKVIAKMTQAEKNNYISVYQDYYSRVYD